jgi:hypothetical protein
MDSGLYVQVFSSVEVIVASLFLIFLLPLVFFIASTKSRRRFVRLPPRTRKARPVRRPPQEAAASEEEEDLDVRPSQRSRQRSRDSAEGADNPE